MIHENVTKETNTILPSWAGVCTSFAFLLQYITEAATQQRTDKIPFIIGVSALYLIMDLFLDFSSIYTGTVLRKRIAQLLRDSVVVRILASNIEEKDERGDAYYLSLLNNNISTIETEYINGILMLIGQIFALLFALIATTLIQPIMTIIVIVLCALPLFVPKLLKNKLERSNREVLMEQAQYLDFLNEIMEGFQSIKVFGREPEINDQHQARNAIVTHILKYALKWKRISMSLSYGMGNFVVVGAWIVGGLFVFKGSIDVPQLIALTTLMNMIAGPFQIISDRYAEIVSDKAILDDLLSFINSESHGYEFKSQNSNIDTLTLEDVSVIKHDAYILKNASLNIKQGQKIAIIGSSGSGKTTLLKVIAGIQHADEGLISINGQCLENNACLSHKDILYIAQNTVIFSATIADNIALFRDYPEFSIEDAIMRAHLSTWYQRNGADLETKINKSNIALSGGELRGVDFARTILEAKPVILFDEPTSGLEKYHASDIMNQLLNLKNQTILVATHNLSEDNISKFDYVYVMENGLIVAHDTSNNIINNAKFLALQMGKSD